MHPGGVNNHIAHLAAAFRELNHDVTVIAPVARDQDVPDGVSTISRSITTVKTGGSDARICFSFRASSRIKRLLEEEQFDVVHLHNPLTPVVSMNFLRHRDAAPNTAMVATLHEYRADKNPWFSLADPLIQRWIERLDGRIAVSEVSRAFNNTYFPGEYEIIPNGIDLQRFNQDVQPLERYAGGPPTVLFVGRLEYRKGFKYLLRAWPWVREAIPNARLLVVGAFNKRRKRGYVLYARRQDIGGVRFIGQATENDLPRYYRTADVFIAPSTGFESFGIVLLEAMATGVPVVASDIPGYRTVLEHGKQGLLVQPRHPQSLAKAIIDLLRDPDLRARMGSQGRIKAADYDWPRVAIRVLDFYKQIRVELAARSRNVGTDA